jgi:hypothetical protein
MRHRQGASRSWHRIQSLRKRFERHRLFGGIVAALCCAVAPTLLRGVLHVQALGTTLRYPYEVRKAEDYFCDLPDLTIAPDVLTLAEHILDSKARASVRAKPS